MDESETTRLRALLERAALPACEAVDNGVGEWSVTHAGPPPWTVAELWDSPAASTDAVEARARLFAAIPTALPGLLDAAERVEREHREAGESTRAAWRESERREQELRDRLIAAERERDDLAATLETRTAEHALAVARVTELEAIIAGRTTPPTDEEIDAHEVAGGMWVATPARKTISGRSWSCAMSTAYEVRRFLVSPGDRWIPLDADGRPCAWPVASKGGAS